MRMNNKRSKNTMRAFSIRMIEWMIGILLSSCFFCGFHNGVVHGRSWTALVDPSIYESSMADIARVINATERELFPLQTAAPTTIIPNTSPSSSPTIGIKPSSTVAKNVSLPSSSSPISTKHPTKRPSHRPSRIVSSSKPTTNPTFLSPHGLLSNSTTTTHAPTASLDNTTERGGCNGNTSLYRVVFQYNGSDSETTITTLTIYILKALTRPYVEPRAGTVDKGGMDRRHLLQNRSNVMHRPSSANIFDRTTPQDSNFSTTRGSNSSTIGTYSNSTGADLNNSTFGLPKRNTIGNFTFWGGNKDSSKDFLCLERQVCYHVEVQGGSHGITWTVELVLENRSSIVANGTGMDGYACQFYILADTNSQDTKPICACNCTEAHPGSLTPTVLNPRPTTTAVPTMSPSTTFWPSSSNYPTAAATFVSTELQQSESPSLIATLDRDELTQSPTFIQSQHHRFTHYPTDYREAVPPAEVKTPFPTVYTD